MATKPAPAPSAGAPADIRDPAVPRLMTDVVERPRLFALLERGALGPVTLITAPAGSGKTMLLSSWLRGAELHRRERGLGAPSRPRPAHRPPRSPSRAARASLVRRVTGGTLLAASLAALTIAVWPASDADKAREDGRQYGEAVAALSAADTSAEVDAALADLHTAALDTRDHAGDAVADQVAAHEDALARVADGFAGAATANDEFEADLYQAELDIAVDDLDSQADDFRAQGADVQQAFWEGYEDGVNGA